MGFFLPLLQLSTVKFSARWVPFIEQRYKESRRGLGAKADRKMHENVSYISKMLVNAQLSGQTRALTFFKHFFSSIDLCRLSISALKSFN